MIESRYLQQVLNCLLKSTCAIFQSYDGNSLASKNVVIAANTWYKLAVQWGYKVAGVKKFRVGVDSGSGISWGTEANFDGSYALGNYLRFFYGGFGPTWYRKVMLFKGIKATSFIDALPAP